MTKFKLNLNIKPVLHTIKPVLHNKYILYGVCIFALINVIHYANLKDFNSLFTLLIIGFLTSFFSKNMVVILSVSIILTYILCPFSVISTEGLEGISDKDNDENKDEEKEDEDEDEDEDKKEKDEVEKVENDEDDEAKIAKVKIDLEEFAQLQSGIVEGLEKIEPMITKAESFVEKFKKGSESFKKITNQKN